MLLDIALALDPPENRDEEERRAESLRRKLGNLGSVNPVAVEEYRKLRERREFISVQLEDLEAAAKALQRIVDRPQDAQPLHRHLRAGQRQLRGGVRAALPRRKRAS